MRVLHPIKKRKNSGWPKLQTIIIIGFVLFDKHKNYLFVLVELI